MIQLSGSLKDIQIDYRTRKALVTFAIDQSPEADWTKSIKNKILSIRISIFHKKRSLDSNAYFHVLCDKLRLVLGISMAECKNHLITSYGQVEYIGDSPLIYKTNAPPEYMREQETIHMSLIKIGDDGAFWYRAYRGSHTYNTAEMAMLIEGAISECIEQGIETATPEEIARMQAAWQTKYESN